MGAWILSHIVVGAVFVAIALVLAEMQIRGQAR